MSRWRIKHYVDIHYQNNMVCLNINNFHVLVKNKNSNNKEQMEVTVVGFLGFEERRNTGVGCYRQIISFKNYATFCESWNLISPKSLGSFSKDQGLGDRFIHCYSGLCFLELSSKRTHTHMHGHVHQ
jgi:hypothetical protein